METILNYLKLDTIRFSGKKAIDFTEYRHTISMIEVDENPFYIPFAGDNRHHWELSITPWTKWDEPDAEWGSTGQTLKFKMISSVKPTIEQFSKHIKTECLAIIKSLNIDLENCYIWTLQQALILDRDDIHPVHVFNFMKNLNKDYSKTNDFLRDYDVYLKRLYQGVKFMGLLISGEVGMSRMSFDYPIGEHFLAFLTNNAKFNDYYEVIATNKK